MYSINKSIMVICMVMELISSLTMLEQNIFYYDLTKSEAGKMINQEIEFTCNKNIEEDIIYTLKQLFSNEHILTTFIPNGVRVTNILYINNSLEIEISNELLDYGGTMRENMLIDQILATIFDFDEINELTIYIEDSDNLFVEGTSIEKYTRNDWEERMKEIE